MANPIFILAEGSDSFPMMALAGISIVAMLVLGFKDMLRFSFARAWAISGVCFAESIRKRVLYITPLAILGVFIITQLQHPQDEQDAIRQTIKTALFATGTLMVITSIILASTNLPKEIDNRVIYTIVTKPTTRLEIVLGKILGFARVSATILLIMGLFSFVYLNVRASRLESGMRGALEDTKMNSITRATLEHYTESGLLTARAMATPQSLQFLSQLPDVKSDVRWFSGAGDQIPQLMFRTDPVKLIAPGNAPPAAGTPVDRATLGAILVEIDLRVDRSDNSAMAATSRPAVPVPMPLLASTQPSTYLPNRVNDPQVSVTITDRDGFDLIPSVNLEPRGMQPLNQNGDPVRFIVQPNRVGEIIEKSGGKFGVQLRGGTRGANYRLDKNSVRVFVVSPAHPELQATQLAPETGEFIFRGRVGRDGEQLRGDIADRAPVAIYHFEGIELDSSLNNIAMELRPEIETGRDDDSEAAEESSTLLEIRAWDRASNTLGTALQIRPENRRWTYFNLDKSIIKDGQCDLVIRCLSKDHWVGLSPKAISIVTSRGSFPVNLLKSLFILWLLSVLVVSIAVFCSTFLSWPIAIVLTIVILLGNWTFTQISDSISSELGHNVATAVFGGEGSSARFRVVSESVDLLTRFLQIIAGILPNIDEFSVTENIERGLAIPWTQIIEALKVIGLFALPMTIFGYIKLKFKEVAP